MNLRVKFKNIRAFVTVMIILTSVGVALLLGAISLWNSSQYLTHEINQKLFLMAERSAKPIEQSLSRVEHSVDALSAVVESSLDAQRIQDPDYLTSYQDFLAPYTLRLTRTTPYAFAGYVYLNLDITKKVYAVWYLQNRESKQFERQSDIGKPEDYSQPQDPAFAYYFRPLAERKGVWTDPYVDKDVKVAMITYAKPVPVQGKQVAIAGMDISFDQLQKMVKDLKVYETGEAYLLTPDYRFIASRSIALGTPLEAVQHGAMVALRGGSKAGKTDPIAYHADGKDWLASYTRLPNGFLLFLTAPRDEIYAEIGHFQLILAGIIVAVAVGAGLIAYRVANQIASPIEELIAAIDRLARNDLTVAMADNDAIGDLSVLSRAFNQMVVNWRKSIGQIQVSCDQVRQNADVVNSSTVQVVQQMEDIATLGDETNGAVKAVATAIDEMTTAISRVAADVGEATRISSQAEQNAHETRATVNQLGHAAGEIGNVVGLIKSIAAQTNLLALNATIEAARAGEAGKSFAVVANEVKHLARQVAEATETIQDRVEEMQTSTEAAVAAISSITGTIEGISTISSAIACNVEQQTSAVQAVNENIQEMVEIAAKVTDRVQNSVSLTQSVSGQAEETTRAVAVIIDNLNDLSTPLVE
jgi:methyl-accepting chemotaxis protein